MNTFLHNAVTAALPSTPKVRQIGALVVGWYRPRHELIWGEVRELIQGADTPVPPAAPKPAPKLRFAV